MTKHSPDRGLQTGAAMLAFMLLIGLTFASGGAAGWVDNRWGQGVDLAAAGKNLQRVPAEFGDWRLEQSEPLSLDVVKMLQCSGSTYRVYRNQHTGAAVTLALIVGPPGPTSVHTPEVCYSSREYKTISAPRRFSVGGPGADEAAFWGMTLEATDLRGGKLSVAYAWNDEHGWVAPSHPRFAFGGAALLYKLQLAAATDGDREQQESEPCRAFLREFLPALDATLFDRPPSSKTSSAP